MKFTFSKALAIGVIVFFTCTAEQCDKPSSDDVQRQQQERILQEGTSQTGMPAIKNFRERKLLKDIYELRDQNGLVTYTYIVAENTGKFVFVCNSIGYGISAATEYTNPQKIDYSYAHYVVIPQADPNGLFSPATAEGTWVMCANPEKKGAAEPQYIEPRVIVTTFKLPTN
jgi:hypothetical protein